MNATEQKSEKAKRPTRQTVADPLPAYPFTLPNGDVIEVEMPAPKNVVVSPVVEIPTPAARVEGAARIKIGDRAAVCCGIWDGSESEPRKVVGVAGWGTVVGIVADHNDRGQPMVARRVAMEVDAFGPKAWANNACEQYGGDPDKDSPLFSGQVSTLAGPRTLSDAVVVPAVLLDIPCVWGATRLAAGRGDLDHPEVAGMSEVDIGIIGKSKPQAMGYSGVNATIISQEAWAELIKTHEVINGAEAYAAFIEKPQEEQRRRGEEMVKTLSAKLAEIGAQVKVVKA